MAIPDLPNAPPQNVPVMIAQANQAQAGDVTTTRTLGICYPVSNKDPVANVIIPVGEAGYYLQQYEHRKFDFNHQSGTVSILQQPKHGVLRLITEADRGAIFSGSEPLDSTNPSYVYISEQGFLGKDSAALLVDVGGIKIKVVYFFHAVDGLPGNESDEIYCGKTGSHWKISSTVDANGDSTITSVEYQSPVTNAADTTLTSATLNDCNYALRYYY
jgi:hypothetical protein